VQKVDGVCEVSRRETSPALKERHLVLCASADAVELLFEVMAVENEELARVSDQETVPFDG